MDTSGTFGQALMDLGTTHSILLTDDVIESLVTADNRKVHPVAHSPGSKLLWRILETEGSCSIDKVTSDSLQRAVRQIRQCHKTFIAADLKCKQKTDILKELDVLVEILLFTTR
ncbi:uncharacterized protein LOC110044688 isoform X1 [Orbicella faveolata]|uniref:uncharacterized protein LOC110044688 isoform X1 n=1 Tax=Orbicella faveolata TaxID=48498 RepID=UPI0009E3FA69|nr:uncharacterized protein LOC110044688 isoform X1 [Orbicella faveolata]